MITEDYDDLDISVDLTAIEQVVNGVQERSVTLPKKHVLYMIRRIRQAEGEVAVACAQAAKMCTDCISAFCDSERSVEELIPNSEH